jgi:predicted enzyme related to lactoylglutathione lyase
MAVPYKICIDCADPHVLAAFWADAMGYVVEDNSALIQQLLGAGVATEADVVTVGGRLAWRTAAVAQDPDSAGRILFQVVPEPKTVKNRVHLDLHVGEEQIEPTVARLEKLGGKRLYEISERGSHWVTMADPEGNEFCVHN